MLFAGVAVAAIALDQAAKALAISHLEHMPLPLLGGLIQFRLTRNPGGAFGLAAPSWVMITVTLVICMVVLAYTVRRAGENPIHSIAMGLVFGGALGNLIDRLRFGSVVDFIDLKVWPVFNIADIAITVGVGLLMIEVLRRR